MKKTFTFILLFLALSVGCLFPTLGTFAMNNMVSGMNHDISGDMMMPCHSGNDSASMHECCESPFSESIAYNGNSSVSDPEEVDNSSDSDGEILCALHESLVKNNIQRLNSPPNYREILYDISGNTYIGLVGIIKNNN